MVEFFNVNSELTVLQKLEWSTVDLGYHQFSGAGRIIA